MEKIRVTIRVTAFNGEISESNWVEKVQVHASNANTCNFVEYQCEINMDDYASFVNDFCLDCIKKDMCLYIEAMLNSTTWIVFTSNSDKDYCFQKVNLQNIN